MLKVKNLSKTFGGIKAVSDCSFHVKEGTITGLIGPNGAGKTTVFNLVSGLHKPDEGHVYFKNKKITGLASHKIASMGMTRTFQLVRLFPKLTVLENIMLARKQFGEELHHVLFNPVKVVRREKLNLQRSLDYLREVGLDEKASELAENLSYGQQKLLELAKALATEPDLILLDEPTAGVNPVMREHLKEVLRKLNDDGKTLLVIEHDMRFVMDICQEVIVLDKGTDLAVGSPDLIQNDKRVLDAYLGGAKR